MKRLTKKIGEHYTFYDCDIICDKCFGGCKVSQQVMDKYGELEDLLEEELGTVDLELTKSVLDEWHSYLQYAGERNAFERMLSDVTWGKVDLERLRELAKADREGRCVVLPCKIGDTVYSIRHEQVPDNDYRMSFHIEMRIVSQKFGLIHADCIGKSVFLTRAEAEAALRREQG